MFSMLFGIVFAVGSGHAQPAAAKPVQKQVQSACQGAACQARPPRKGLFKRWAG